MDVGQDGNLLPVSVADCVLIFTDDWNPPAYYEAKRAEEEASMVWVMTKSAIRRADNETTEGASTSARELLVEAEREADKNLTAAAFRTRNLRRAWSHFDRHFVRLESSFIKRELYDHEKDGPAYQWDPTMHLSRDRLRNERAALQLITSSTDLPVPKVIRAVDEPGKPYLLETEVIPGQLLLMFRGEEYIRAVAKTTDYIENTVLPTLRNLCSNQLGLNGAVIPPPRIFHKDTCLDPIGRWDAVTIPGANFVFCHNDLGQHNILLDPETLEVTGIIDWEYGVYFPAEFEYPYWTSKNIHAQTIEKDEESNQMGQS